MNRNININLIWNVTKFKLKMSKNLLYFCMIFTAIFASIQLFSMNDFFRDKIDYIQLIQLDSGVTFIFPFIIVVLGTIIKNEQQHDLMGAYPISKGIHFWSDKLTTVIQLIIVLVIFLVDYGIKYIACRYYIPQFPNSIMAYDFSLEAVIIGFFVTLSYWILLMAVLSFIKSIFYRHPILSVGLGIMAITIHRQIRQMDNSQQSILSNLLHGYTHEISIGLFFIKVWVSVVILLLLSYHFWLQADQMEKKSKWLSRKYIALGCVGAVILLNIVTGTMFVSHGSARVENIEISQDYEKIKEQGIVIPMDNVDKNRPLAIDFLSNNDLQDGQVYLYDGEDIVIVANFSPEKYDGLSTEKLLNLEYGGEIIDNRLVVNCDVEYGGNFILLSPWIIPNQFSRYEGKVYFDQIGSSYEGFGRQTIDIYIPQGMIYQSNIEELIV